jgi:hypothetical protein
MDVGLAVAVWASAGLAGAWGGWRLSDRRARALRRAGEPAPGVPDPRGRTPLDDLSPSARVRSRQTGRNERFARQAGAADGWHAEDREMGGAPGLFDQDEHVLRLNGAEVEALRQRFAGMPAALTRAERSLLKKVDAL